MDNHRSGKDLVKRTAKLEKELSAKTHELEIEAALEKVRTVAMRMNKPGDLPDVCKTLYKQFLLLGFSEMRNAMVNIHNDAVKSFINYDYSDEIGKSTNQLTYDIHPLVEKQIKKIRSANDAFSETYFSGEDLVEWRKFRKRIGEKNDPRLRKTRGLYYYFYSIGTGSIGISTFGPISKEKKALLKRFRNVFNLSYQRYIDIAKAEAQVREAKIEAALEKVRSRSLAMHKSEELQQVVAVAFERLRELNISMDAANIDIFSESTRDADLWIASPGQEYASCFHLPYVDYLIPSTIFNAKEKGDDFFAKTFSFEEKNKYFNYLFEHSDFKHLPESRKNIMLAAAAYTVSFAFTKSAAISIHNYSDKSFSDEENNILKRFARVFEQAYTRFLDLQKAEAQAREAQIEAALEKVRAKVMAMNSSDELNETSLVFGEQLRKLGIDWQLSYFWLIEEDKDDNTFWITWPDKQTSTTTYSLAEADQSFKDCIIAWRNQVKVHNTHVPFENVQEWLDTFERITSDAGGVALEIMKAENFKEGVYYYDAMIKFGSFGILINRSISEEEQNIQSRFAVEFERAYKRFLDLQKAETQAREAQIETALERVRSRTMAMHRSEEIADILGKMFEELKRLDMVLVRVLIWIFNHEEKYISWWSANAEVENTANSYRLDYNEHPVFLACLEAWQKKVPLKLYTLSGAEKDSWQDHLFNNTGLSKLPDMVQKGMRSEGTIFTTSAISDYGLLMSGSLEPLSDENTDIIQRFGRVFQQSYTRYIDVQKAEAQAREAQIQLALERVRARTMAMQKSDELVDTAALLFQQIKELGIQQWGNSFQLWDDDMKAVEAWTCTQGMEIQRFKIPATEDPAMMNLVKAAQRGEDLYVEEMGGEALEDHYKFMYSLPVFKEILDNLAAAGITPPKFQINYAAYFSYGYILFITHEPFPEAHDIFKRFAKVFEQTYTRFLDLQNAETQAREAKIEAALEKIRSRSLAMHKSDELWEVVAVVFEKFQELNFAIDGAAFITTFIEGTRDINGWVAGNESQPYPTNLRLPYLDSPSINDIWKAKESGLDFFSKTYSFEEKNQWLRYAFENSGLKSMTDEFKNWILEQPCMTQSLALGKNSILGIHFHYDKTLSETEVDILKRFSKVFDQAYIRFLDLQKAEAQAREAQIQLALERVRARTMAMQKSDELPETAAILFEQFKSLGQELMQMTIGIVNEADGVIEFSVTDWSGSGAGVNRAFNLSIEEPTLIKKMYAGWKENKKSIVVDLTGKDLENWINYRNKMSGVTVNSADTSGRRVITSAFFSKGHLSFSTPVLPVAESIQLLERFAQVFDLTYTRFLDLKKAETQIREAQIEAALEKVRSRSLAMHKSEELKEVVAVVFEKLQNLKFTMNDGAAVIITFIKDSKDHIQWIADAEHAYAASFKTPYSDHSISTDIFNAKESSIDFFSKLYPFAEKNNYFKYLFENTDYKVLPDEVKELLLESKAYGFSIAFEKNSAILIPTNTGKLLSESEKDILKRFAKVFEQSYTRFLDLQKAEAQARESQIQLALERVRARTMAMQKSDELAEAARVLYEEFRTLNINTFLCGYCFYKEEQDKQTVWVTFPDGTIIPDFIDFPIEGDHILNKRYEDWKQKKPLHVLEIQGEENKEHHRFLASKVSDQAANEIFAQIPDRIIVYCANFSTGYLFIIATEFLTGEEEDVIIRFAKVFELTYTRFNDLKQAEAQARESQIQLALERVRARTMAMQKSDELMEASNLLLQQVQSLGIPVWACGYNIWEIGEKVSTAWMSVLGAIQPSFRLPLTEHRTFIHMYESRLKGEAFYVEEVSGEELADHYRYMFSLPDFKEIATKQLQGGSFPLPQSQTHHVFNFKHGNLIFLSAEAIPEARDIFKRFTAVFEQTYTRFLDLQKAEAQARQAQIEASLERVRASAMAMHRSDELSNVLAILFEQFDVLKIQPVDVHLDLFDLEKNTFSYRATGKEGKRVIAEQIVDLGSRPEWQALLQKWKKGKPDTVDFSYYPKEVIRELMAFFPDIWAAMPGDAIMSPEDFPDGIFDALGFCKFGYIGFHHHRKATEEEQKILIRFANEFERLYQRFLDLQKAEAQAREAQIELGLERVRARAMAMQKSDELSELVDTVFKELTKLDFALTWCIINIIDEPSCQIWFGQQIRILTKHLNHIT